MLLLKQSQQNKERELRKLNHSSRKQERILRRNLHIIRICIITRKHNTLGKKFLNHSKYGIYKIGIKI